MKEGVSMSKRDEHTKKVKENILNAADELLKTKGIEAVTVNNICKMAKVSVGSFYHHFSSKENVLSHYLIDAFEKRRESFETINDEDIIRSLLQSYRLYNSFLLEKGYDFIVNYYVPSNRAIFSYNSRNASKEDAPIVSINEKLIEEALRKGYLRSDITAQELNSDLSVIEKGSILDWCVSEGSYDLLNHTDHLLKNYLMNYVTTKYKRKFLSGETK